MSSGFESAFIKILNREAEKLAKRRPPPRKLELGDTRAGRADAVGFVEPARVPVPDEYLEPQPVFAKNRLYGPIPESNRKHKRHGRRATDMEWVVIREKKNA